MSRQTSMKNSSLNRHRSAKYSRFARPASMTVTRLPSARDSTLATDFPATPPQPLEKMRLYRIVSIEHRNPIASQLHCIGGNPVTVGRVDPVDPLLEVDVLLRKPLRLQQVVGDLGRGHFRKS